MFHADSLQTPSAWSSETSEEHKCTHPPLPASRLFVFLQHHLHFTLHSSILTSQTSTSAILQKLYLRHSCLQYFEHWDSKINICICQLFFSVDEDFYERYHDCSNFENTDFLLLLETHLSQMSCVQTQTQTRRKPLQLSTMARFAPQKNSQSTASDRYIVISSSVCYLRNHVVRKLCFLFIPEQPVSSSKARSAVHSQDLPLQWLPEDFSFLSMDTTYTAVSAFNNICILWSDDHR